ncbi:MAG: hypothetical protein U5L96_21525 [Owenweeksia sp.]|nr:hypothetical protein [Owenweeksia sp.]
MKFEITDEMEKSEISAEKLPDEVHRDIKNNYHNAEILRAFRVKHEGAEDRGYLVLVKQGSKTWTIKFDSEGNALR